MFHALRYESHNSWLHFMLTAIHFEHALTFPDKNLVFVRMAVAGGISLRFQLDHTHGKVFRSIAFSHEPADAAPFESSPVNFSSSTVL